MCIILSFRKGSTLTIPSGMNLSFKENRGIYVEGTLKIIGDGESAVLMNSTDDHAPWYGIILNSTEKDVSDIHNAELVNTDYGFVSYTDLFEFKRSTIFNSSHSCITLNLKNNYNYSIEEINMKHCSDIGIRLAGEGKIRVDNVHIENARTGIYVYGKLGKLQLTSSIIEHCVFAVYIEYGYSSYDAGDFKLEHCRIAHCTNGINYGVRFVGRPAQIAINNNMFTNISKNTLSINFISYEYRYNKQSTGYIDIGLNTFRNVCDIYLKTWNNALKHKVT